MENAALQHLVDKQAIRDLVMQYCRAIDRRQLELLKALYHEDAIDDHGAFSAGPVGKFLELLPTILDSMITTSHQILNHYIEVDGDYAEGEVYMIAYHLTRDESGKEIEVIVGGRYLDQYEKRGGVWKFKYRKIVSDWNQIQPTLSDWEAPMFAGTARGEAYKTDPSWSLFRLIGKQ
jgi:hypothetical protein